MTRMKIFKKIFLVCIGLLFTGTIFLFEPSFGGATSIEELRSSIESKNDEIKKIQEELRVYNEELSKTKQTSKTLNSAITALNKNIANLKRQIALAEAQIEERGLEIRETQILIKGKEVEINENESAMAGILQALAVRKDTGPFEIFLQNKNLSDFFDYLEQNKSFQHELQARLSAYRDAKRDLEEKKGLAEKKRVELTRLEGSLADKKIITESQKKEQQTVLTETKNQEKRYQQLVTETEKRYEEVQREIEELENELRKRVDPTSLPPRRVGYFVWPREGIISQKYGETPFARYSDFYKFHNGIDIASSVGSEVVVADKGKVIAVGNSDVYCPRGAYGKYIVIDHSDNLITLYAHLSLQKVSVGQTVERGEFIGYVGSTGRSTGPHLHFTVYDARTFELRQSKICGILPYGGSINPMDYL